MNPTMLYTVKLTSGEILKFFDDKWILTLEPGAYAFTKRSNRDIVHYPFANVVGMTEEHVGLVPVDKKDREDKK